MLFKSVLETIEYPSIVRFQKTLGTVLAAAPTIDKLIENGTMDVKYTTEKKYYEIDDDYSTYLFRYGGNIVPQFIGTSLSYEDKKGSESYMTWRTVSGSGAFNISHRKKLWSELSQNDRKCLNYISKQKYQPDYPSIDYYYIESTAQNIDEPFVPDGYLGEVCWFKKNLVYFVPRKFTVVEKCTADEMNEDKMLQMFVDYVSRKGYFRYLVSSGKEYMSLSIIEDYLWKMYAHSSEWEYSSIDNIELYDFKVTYSLV